jgi:hypothetical protein
VQNNLFRLAFSLCLPLALPAGTLTLEAFCPPDFLGNAPSCMSPPGYPFGSASASGGPWHVGAGGQGQAYAIASYDADLVIDFTGGNGAGFYVPCLSANESGNGGAGVTAVANLGGVGVQASPNLLGSCGLFTMFSGEIPIPFVFGVPQIQSLHLFAQAGFGSSGSADFSGTFIVLDASRNVIPGASASIQETPEPTTGATVLCGLALAIIGRRFLVRSSHIRGSLRLHFFRFEQGPPGSNTSR